jgi:ATP phosphoribosyltransferase
VIKIALPAGDLRSPVAEVLTSSGLHVEGYGEGSRAYRLPVRGRDDLAVRVFRERDIPIQIALGNYVLGVCSLSWVKEMQALFPGQPIVPVCDLGVGSFGLYAASSTTAGGRLQDIAGLSPVRIASDYPNLAEMFAMAARLPRYRIQSVWGAAEAYPPEDADAVVISAANEAAVRAHGLLPFHCLLQSSAWVIANAEALRSKGLASVLGPLIAAAQSGPKPEVMLPAPVTSNGLRHSVVAERSVVRMAIPDGHQQRHVVSALADAGLSFTGYDDAACVRRPASGIDGLDVKVVRPHDMPQLVALGQFDIAITGRDCLLEHLHRFPSSPVQELVDLKRGQYNLSAVVTEDLPADTIEDALAHWRAEGKSSIRVASEFMGTADYYARSRHLWRYQVMPIAGASEGFVPEDAELLIEGTETGKTLRENRLKPIDLLYRSTTCVIGHGSPSFDAGRRAVFDHVLGALRRTGEAAASV